MFALRGETFGGSIARQGNIRLTSGRTRSCSHSCTRVMCTEPFPRSFGFKGLLCSHAWNQSTHQHHHQLPESLSGLYVVFLSGYFSPSQSQGRIDQLDPWPSRKVSRFRKCSIIFYVYGLLLCLLSSKFHTQSVTAIKGKLWNKSQYLRKHPARKSRHLRLPSYLTTAPPPRSRGQANDDGGNLARFQQQANLRLCIVPC